MGFKIKDLLKAVKIGTSVGSVVAPGGVGKILDAVNKSIDDKDDPNNEALKRGIEYLTRTQNPDGSWTELETTGTGFPKVFYLKYDMYRNSWPLLALATYKKLLPKEKKA